MANLVKSCQRVSKNPAKVSRGSTCTYKVAKLMKIVNPSHVNFHQTFGEF